MDRNSLKWQNQIYIFFAYRTSIFYIRTIKSSLTVQCKYFMFSAGSSWGSLEPLASNRVGCCKLIHFVVSFFHISCCFAICTPFLCATWNCTYRQRDGNILETRCTPPLFQHVTNGLCRVRNYSHHVHAGWIFAEWLASLFGSPVNRYTSSSSVLLLTKLLH